MSISFTIDSTVHTTYRLTPGQMESHRDVILHATQIANWECMRLCEKSKINNNNANENETRLPHEYSVVDNACLNVFSICSWEVAVGSKGCV